MSFTKRKFVSMLDTDALKTRSALNDFLQQGNYLRAAHLLIDNVEQSLESTEVQELAPIFNYFPADFLHEALDLRYAQARVYAHTGRLSEAINLLDRVRFTYQFAERNYDKALECCLELARIYISREKFHTALHYLSEEAEPLIARGLVTDLQLKARFFLRKAEVYTDLGQLREDFNYSRQALALFTEIGDVAGQFDVLLRLVFAMTQVADYAGAASKLDIAWSYYALGNSGVQAKARLLNFQVHLRWYQGQLDQALNDAHAYQTLVDQERFSNFRVFARILHANLYRALGEYEKAELYYVETRGLIAELDYQFFTPWVDAHSAWLRLLQGHYDEARSLIHRSLATSDLGQAMSFQITLAVLELLADHDVTAERLFREALAYYEKSGDELTVCVIHLYLTQTAHKQQQDNLATEYLNKAFGWLAERHIDYFPHWWHPALVAQLCTFALARQIYPEVAERILLQRLPASGAEAVRCLLTAETGAVRTRAAALLRMLEGEVANDLPQVDEPLIKQVLDELVANQMLRADGLARLYKKLMTATRRGTPNPTLIAVFGLYVHGHNRKAIAQRLGCAATTVRNYITLIYDQFEVPKDAFANPPARHARLVEIAREQGLV